MNANNNIALELQPTISEVGHLMNVETITLILPMNGFNIYCQSSNNHF